jgi:ATP-dependent exoDNAse (exonuclease V) alpha subunit
MYKATVTWNFNVKNVLSPEELYLKVWATVMITKNIDKVLVNWDMWEIKKLGKWYVVFHSFRREQDFEIWFAEWEDKRIDETWNETVAWTYTQIPIKLWWAITIHKSQWLTLEKVVFHYNKHMDRAAIYVGLSRAVTWKDLYIKRL